MPHFIRIFAIALVFSLGQFAHAAEICGKVSSVKVTPPHGGGIGGRDLLEFVMLTQEGRSTHFIYSDSAVSLLLTAKLQSITVCFDTVSAALEVR